MIKLFKKIRQRLLSENRFGKYLLYAIGEILIIICGVLFAVKINNLNETYNLKKIEKQILNDIRKDLLQSKELLLENFKNHERRISDLDVIIHNIEVIKTYNDSLSSKFTSLIYFRSPYLTFASYENLKIGKGIDLISNDSLKQKIVHLHEYTYSFLIEDIDRDEWQHLENITRPALYKYFNYISINHIIPKDYPTLICDGEILSIFKFTRDLRTANLYATSLTLQEIEVVIDAISNELDK